MKQNTRPDRKKRLPQCIFFLPLYPILFFLMRKRPNESSGGGDTDGGDEDAEEEDLSVLEIMYALLNSQPSIIQV